MLNYYNQLLVATGGFKVFKVNLVSRLNKKATVGNVLFLSGLLEIILRFLLNQIG